MAQLPADPHTLYSFINRGATWADLAKEMVDNAFDAAAGNANEIDIHIGDGFLTFTDSGNGIGKNINRLGTLGASGSFHREGNIGQYGVGAKLWLCKAHKLAVETISNGKKYEHLFNARPILKALAAHKTPPWLNGYEGNGSPTSEKSFTQITLCDLRKGPPIHLQSLMSELQKTFWIALAHGMKIVVYDSRKGARTPGKHEITALAPAQWSDLIEFQSSVNGKPYKARIGILSDSIGAYSGLWFGFLHRNICIEKSSLPNRPIPARIHGQIELSAEWRHSFSNYKDQIIDDYELLLEDIEKQAKSIFDLADEYAEDIQLENISLEIEGKVTDALMQALAKKKKDRGNGGGEKPEHDPDNPIPEIETKLDSDENGTKKVETNIKQSRATGVKLKWEHLGSDTLYQVRPYDKTIVITLNRDCPKLQAQRRLPNYPGIYLAMGTAIALHCLELIPAQIVSYYSGMLGDAEQSENQQQMIQSIIAWWGFVANESKSAQAA